MCTESFLDSRKINSDIFLGTKMNQRFYDYSKGIISMPKRYFKMANFMLTKDVYKRFKLIRYFRQVYNIHRTSFRILHRGCFINVTTSYRTYSCDQRFATANNQGYLMFKFLPKLSLIRNTYAHHNKRAVFFKERPPLIAMIETIVKVAVRTCIAKKQPGAQYS